MILSRGFTKSPVISKEGNWDCRRSLKLLTTTPRSKPVNRESTRADVMNCHFKNFADADPCRRIGACVGRWIIAHLPVILTVRRLSIKCGAISSYFPHRSTCDLRFLDLLKQDRSDVKMVRIAIRTRCIERRCCIKHINNWSAAVQFQAVT